MFNVYQHWDPLRVCMVGRSYPPEFYDWITVSHVRDLFRQIATETEEDFRQIIAVLERFDVEVLRPDIPANTMVDGRWLPPPMAPRDTMTMVGNQFYENYSFDLLGAYHDVRDPSWPVLQSAGHYDQLPGHIIEECEHVHGFANARAPLTAYDNIFKIIRDNNNDIRCHTMSSVTNGAQLTRLGRDLFFGTLNYDQDLAALKHDVDREFPDYRNHVVNTGGHSDGTFCPVCPGLIISLHDVPTYADTFPGWEVVYLERQSWHKIRDWVVLKKRNGGKWWIPGFERDHAVINTVEEWLGHWTGYVEETVFDVNMLIIDPKNVMVFNYNKQVFDALDRYGITPHVVPLRHRYFWDGGIHCVTLDLHRQGTMQDFFLSRD